MTQTETYLLTKFEREGKTMEKMYFDDRFDLLDFMECFFDFREVVEHGVYYLGFIDGKPVMAEVCGNAISFKPTDPTNEEDANNTLDVVRIRMHNLTKDGDAIVEESKSEERIYFEFYYAEN